MLLTEDYILTADSTILLTADSTKFTQKILWVKFFVKKFKDWKLAFPFLRKNSLSFEFYKNLRKFG